MTQTIAIAAIVAASSLAHAESPETNQLETRTKTVSFNRVEAQTAEACKSAALDTAVQSVNVPEVSSLHGFTGTIDVIDSP